jgi:hypothetical protein
MLYIIGLFLVLLGAAAGYFLAMVPLLILGGICVVAVWAMLRGEHGEAGPGIAFLAFGVLIFLIPMGLVGLVVRLAEAGLPGFAESSDWLREHLFR